MSKLTDSVLEKLKTQQSFYSPRIQSAPTSPTDLTSPIEAQTNAFTTASNNKNNSSTSNTKTSGNINEDEDIEISDRFAALNDEEWERTHYRVGEGGAESGVK